MINVYINTGKILRSFHLNLYPNKRSVRAKLEKTNGVGIKGPNDGVLDHHHFFQIIFRWYS